MDTNQSANIGVSLTTPAHAQQGLAGSIEKDAVRRCCALAGLAARAMRQVAATHSRRGAGYRGIRAPAVLRIRGISVPLGSWRAGQDAGATRLPSSERYSHTIVAPASAVISATS